ncbi:MAG TPA: gamma-butyrobetaine hydroxylase-like domain-containing protein [Candidatus Binataceae bacterium]|nr:gamma-butyrobetaine hydroxylase-like domain-containing protein [Candidatus Binataceae bacterium]
MALIKPKEPKIKGVSEVGRYAIGVQWTDGHDSIYPLDNLRRYCPCLACSGKVAGEIPPASQRLLQLTRLGEQAMFLEWADGHETIYATGQLRDICGCALCIGEPERPVTGR